MPDQFWELTPTELNLIIEIHVEKMRDQRKSGLVAAFYSAYFSRLEKLSGSDLEKVLESLDKAQDGTMSDEAMYAIVKRISNGGG